MKINKIFSKINEGYISALCINIGANTYKANQGKNKDNSIYNFFGNRKKIIFIFMIISFFLSILLTIFFIIHFDFELEKEKLFINLYKILLRSLCKNFMAVFYITQNIMILVNLNRLENKNIFCFDRSRLLNSGEVNTIFFNKSIFSFQDSLEIYSYHPIYFNAHKANYLSFKFYLKKQCKEMNMILLNYYKENLNKRQSNNNLDYNYNLLRFSHKQLFNTFYNKSNEYTTLLIECLLSCNNVEKYNMQFFANNIEAKLFIDMKWDIKEYDYINNNKDKIDLNFRYIYSYNSNNNCLNDSNSNNNNKYNLIENKIVDIFPTNYYKIREAPKYRKINRHFLIKKTNEKEKLSNNKTENPSININKISQDISKSHIDLYKLRIYKKFIQNGTFNSSSIVYNFMTKELRFMTKGMPEYILDKCDKNSIPENLINTFSFYRRKGLIIIVCASKLINID